MTQGISLSDRINQSVQEFMSSLPATDTHKGVHAENVDKDYTKRMEQLLEALKQLA